MERISDYLNKTVAHFESKKIKDPKYYAEKLLAETLKTNRMDIYLQLTRPLTEEEVTAYRARIKQFLSDGRTKTSILQALQLLKQVFRKEDIPEADLNAEYIIAHLIGVKRLELKFIEDRALTEEELQFLSLYKTRRLNREPLEYILGTAEFFARPFFVNKHVLIPRPETEQLIETCIRYLSKFNGSVLDIGTGSGCIPITLKKELPNLELTSIDVSEQALYTARKNADAHQCNIQFEQCDFLNEALWPHLPRYHHIVSNPPYISLNEFETLEPEVKLFEPSIALHDKGDGLLFYQKIVQFAKEHLHPEGYIFLEYGYNQKEALCKYVEECSYLTMIETLKDYSGHDRLCVIQKTSEYISPN